MYIFHLTDCRELIDQCVADSFYEARAYFEHIHGDLAGLKIHKSADQY